MQKGFNVFWDLGFNISRARILHSCFTRTWTQQIDRAVASRMKATISVLPNAKSRPGLVSRNDLTRTTQKATPQLARASNNCIIPTHRELPEIVAAWQYQRKLL